MQRPRVELTRALVERVAAEEAWDGGLKIGTMIELPRACLVAGADLGILERSPFGTLDTDGVGELIAIALARGRAARPGLEAGISGEHGGDPDSIRFCHGAGPDYVRCSPFRVPVARVAAAQAAVAAAER